MKMLISFYPLKLVSCNFVCVISGGNPHLWPIFNLIGPVEAKLVFFGHFICSLSLPIVGGGEHTSQARGIQHSVGENQTGQTPSITNPPLHRLAPPLIKKTHREIAKSYPEKSNRFWRCRVVLTKKCHYYSLLLSSSLSLLLLSLTTVTVSTDTTVTITTVSTVTITTVLSCVIILVLSHNQFVGFVTI